MINKRKRLKVKFCKGRNARLTLSFQYVNRWFKTLKTALPYTLSGSTEPGGTSLEPWESLSTVSRVASLNSHLHHLLTSSLPSLSTQTLWFGTFFSVVISGPPDLVFHLVTDLDNKVLYFHQPSCCEEELYPSPRSLQTPHHGLVIGHM